MLMAKSHGHEPTAWMRQAAADVHAQLVARGLRHPPRMTIVTMLHPCRPGSIEDRTCDRCRRFDATGMHVFMYAPVDGVAVGIGLCDDCYELELGQVTP